MEDQEQKQVWLRPREVADRGLILTPSGRRSYDFIVRLINKGLLPAKRWNGKYFIVHVDDIKRYVEDPTFNMDNQD